MAEESTDILSLPLEVRAELAMKAAFKQLLAEHLRDGLPIYLWREGRVVAVPPEELSSDSSQ
jgi:hypothetical protein